jgi:hypothetical protein
MSKNPVVMERAQRKSPLKAAGLLRFEWAVALF